MSLDTLDLAPPTWAQMQRPGPPIPIHTSRTISWQGDKVVKEYTGLELSLLQLLELNKVNLGDRDLQLVFPNVLPDRDRISPMVFVPTLKTDNQLQVGTAGYSRIPVGDNDLSENENDEYTFSKCVNRWKWHTATLPTFKTIEFRTGHRTARALTLLKDALKVASVDNWDGYGAQPVSLNSSEYAMRFLETLPITIPLPEVSVDPDGEVCFEWYKAPTQVFTVSFAAAGQLAYAGLFDVNETHGTEGFEDEIPTTVLVSLDRLFLSDKAAGS